MIAQHSFTIPPFELRGMRADERDMRRKYIFEAEKRRLANFILGGMSFKRAAGEGETYRMTIIVSSEYRYLAFKAKMQDELIAAGVHGLAYKKILELFKQFETKDDEDHYSPIQGPAATP